RRARLVAPAADDCRTGIDAGPSQGRLGRGGGDAAGDRSRRTDRAGPWDAAVPDRDQVEADLSCGRGVRLELPGGGGGGRAAPVTACRIVGRRGLGGAAAARGGDLRTPEPAPAAGSPH